MSRARIAIAVYVLLLSADRLLPAQPTPEPTISPITIPSTSATAVSGAGTGAILEAPRPLVVRVDQLPTVVLQGSGTGSGWTAKEVIPSLAGGLGFVAAIASIVVTLVINNRAMAQRENEFQKSIVQKSNESELTQLQEKLDKFYGPYLQLSETNALLAREFIARQPDEPGGDSFRTLPALLSAERRTRLAEDKNDWTIIGEIISIDTDLDRMIRKNAGLVDDQVQEYLARVSSHYRVIRLAYEEKLSGDPYGHLAKYYVYTWQVDKVLRLEIDRLRRRCRLLREHPATAHPPIEPLSIPAKWALGPWPDPRKDWPPKAVKQRRSEEDPSPSPQSSA